MQEDASAAEILLQQDSTYDWLTKSPKKFWTITEIRQVFSAIPAKSYRLWIRQNAEIAHRMGILNPSGKVIMIPRIALMQILVSMRVSPINQGDSDDEDED